MNKVNLYLTTILCVSVILCSSCDKEKQQNRDQQELILLLTKVRTFAESSRCGDDIEIKFLPLGNKACGGPSSYIAYTNTINVQELEKLIKNYNELEKKYNKKWQIVSDCAFISGVRSVDCKNGKLEVMY